MRSRNATSKATALAKPLHGQDEVDEALLDQAVEHINSLYEEKTLELVLAMGEYVLSAFFGGDTANLDAQKTHVSWRALAKREDLRVSHIKLWYAVAIAAQCRQLPAGIGKALNISQHRRLVTVQDPDAKLRLAEKAAKGLTVKQLEAEIAKQRKREKKSRGGRPSLPAHIKALRRLPKLVEPMTREPVTADDVALIGADRMEALRQQLVEQIETLTAAKTEIDDSLKEFLEGTS